MSVYARNACSGDIGALKALWKTVFGDSDEHIEAFYEHYFNPEMAVVADDGLVPAAAGYLLPVGSYHTTESALPCAMVYAVAAHPDYRNRGYGMAVVSKLISTAFDSGYGAIVICPTEDSLFEYYSRNTEFRDFFHVDERVFTSFIQPESDDMPLITPADANDYILLSRQILGDWPHIEFDELAVSYQALLCRQNGGSLYRIESHRGIACAAVEIEPEGTVSIKELLVSGMRDDDAIAAIASKHQSQRYIARMPATLLGSRPYVRRFGMIAFRDKTFDTAFRMANRTPYYGLAFD